MNIILLYIICIISRILFIYLSFLSLSTRTIYLYFAFFYTILGIGSFYHFVTKIRKKGAFGQYIWWHFLRPIHGIFFLISGYLIYKKNNKFIYILIIDTIISVTGFVRQQFINKIL